MLRAGNITRTGKPLNKILGLTLLACAALKIGGCKGESYPEVHGHTIGESGEIARGKLQAAKFHSRVAWDGTLLLGEGAEKECNTTSDFPGESMPCQSITLNFIFPLVGSHARADSELYAAKYFQRPEKPIAASVWLKEIQAHFGELKEVDLYHNKLQNLESRRYVRVLSGSLQPADLDILKEDKVADSEMASGCNRSLAMARVQENRREGMTLSYAVEVMDVQRLCRKRLEIEKLRATEGGSADQLKFK